MAFEGKQRSHIAYVYLSSSGPETGTTRSGPRGIRRSRDGADLAFTTADCDWFHTHLEDSNYDTGIAEAHHRLVNPGLADLFDIISSAGQFLNGYQDHPEWDGGQITFVYAGHGAEPSGDWVLKDGEVGGTEIANRIAAAVKPSSRRCRVDLISDSCFAGAFFSEFLSHCWGPQRHRLFPCQALGAALGDELAWELDELGHGAFTYAFKSMFEPLELGKPSLPRHGSNPLLDTHRLRSGGVSWLTDDEQHAFEYLNGHLEVLGAGHVNLHECETLSPAQVLQAMSDALAVRPHEEVKVR